MNFNAIFKNAKILKIGPVEQKLSNIRQITMGKIRWDTVLYNTAYRRDTVLYNTVYHWFPVFHFFCQITMAKFAEIRYCTIPYICVIKVIEEVDNTSSIFIGVFFTDIQECSFHSHNHGFSVELKWYQLWQTLPLPY